MNKNYRELLNNVRNRSNPENLVIRKSLREELSTISYSDILLYIKTAMTGVESEYTRKSKDAGEKVRSHLDEILTNVSYRFQGSVMTNTHIKGYSDIDLLVICEKFYSYSHNDAKAISSNSYKYKEKLGDKNLQKIRKELMKPKYSGNSLDDLRENRTKSELKLKGIYSQCDVSHSKAIRIKNKDLNREVDIVTSNWYDDIISIINDKGEYRGIQIYNKAKHQKENPDYPFLTISRINKKSADTNGRLKRMIRFLKNIKEDSRQDIELSSFDINAICYDIDTNKYSDLEFYNLVPVIYNQLDRICKESEYRTDLRSVDGREYIFRNNDSKVNELYTILSEIEGILNDLKQIAA